MKSGKANDRLRTARPKDGWKQNAAKNKKDSVAVRKDTLPPVRPASSKKTGSKEF